MPYVDGVYTPAHNFQQEYESGQKKIRADYMDEQFTDLAGVLTDYMGDVTAYTEACRNYTNASAVNAAAAQQHATEAIAVIDAKVDDVEVAAAAAAAAVVDDCVKIAGDSAIAVSGATLNVTNGACFTKTITANTTFTFTVTGLGTGKAACFVLILTNGGSKTVTWPSSVKWTDGDIPDLARSGVDVLTFMTPNGGTTWYGVLSVSEAA